MFIFLTLILLLSSLLFQPIWADSQHTDIIIAASEYNYPPYCTLNDDSSAGGFSVELLKIVLNSMGKEVVFSTGYWNDIKNDLKNGTIDVLPLVGRTPERETYFDFTIPYLPMHGAIVVRYDNTDIKTLEDLKGRRVAVMKGDNAEEFMIREFSGAELYTTTTFVEALTGLSKGVFDAVVIQRLLAVQLIKDLALKDLRIIEPPIDEFRQDFCFAVQEGDKELLAILNEGLAIVTASGEFRRLYYKWFGASSIVKESRIVIGCDYNYPPWEYLDDEGRPAGFNVEVTKSIAREMDLDITFYVSVWEDIVTKLESGDIDIVQGMLYSEERAKKFEMSAAYAFAHHVIVTRKGEDISNDSMLKYREVIVGNMEIMHEYALKNDFKNIFTAYSAEQALSMLASGEHDFAIVERIQAHNIITKNKLTNLQITNDNILTTEFCYSVLKGNEINLSQFEQGLEILKSSGKLRQIRKKWFGVGEPLEPVYVIKIILMILSPIALSLFIFIIWSIMLRRNVNKKTAELRKEIEARIHSEESLAESERLYRTLFNSMAQGVVYQDREGNLISANPAAERILGLDINNMLGSNPEIPLLMTVDEQGRNLPRDEHPAVIALKTGQPVSNHIMGVLNKRSNNYVWILVSSIPQFREGEHKPYQVFTTFHDITDIRKAEESIRKVDRLNSLGVLAGGIAHDFNNLLTGVMANLSILQETLNSDIENVELIEQALKASESAKNLVKQLLTFSQGGKPHIKSIDMKSILEDSAHFILSGSSIRLTLNIEKELRPVWGDKDQIEQVVQNLIINAKQASRPDSIITITAENTIISLDNPGLSPGQYVLTRIADTGKGIPQEILSSIFDPYFTTKPDGSGLGLAIVESIIRRHFGFIDVKSILGQGTEFSILLPVSNEPVRDSVNCAGIDSDDISVNSSILIMDDNKSILSVAEKILSRKGFIVDTCIDGEQAISKYADKLSDNEPYSAVILDLTVPGKMGGKETAQRILSMDPDAVLIVSSGYSNDSAISEYRKYGFKGVVVKPYRAKELITEVVRVIKEK